MKREETTMNNDEKDRTKHCKMMKNRGKRKHDEE